MIISASRRTDIPAFYSDWFMNRISEGYLLVRNPMNHNQISRINLYPDVVDCIVFWTKNPTPMLDSIDRLNQLGFNNKYYFQFTLNSYDKDIEVNLPSKGKLLIDTFKRLSDTIGKHRVIWRYDPIMLGDKYTLDYHVEYFEKIANRLNGYTEKCIFSFYDDYKSVKKAVKSASLHEPDLTEMNTLAKAMSDIEKTNRMILETCAEKIDLSAYGINHASCIDRKLIERIIGHPLKVGKDRNQRLECGCIQSIDIGKYNTCLNGCIYCYANHNRTMLDMLQYNAMSPMLCDRISESEFANINNREMKSLIDAELQI